MFIKDKPIRFLLINPWIYDFAAYNLWARPLGLLKVAEFLSSFAAEFHLIDCMEDFYTRRYNTGKYLRTSVEKPKNLKHFPRQYCRYGMPVDEFAESVKRCLPFHAVLVTSIMTYWYPGIQKVVEILREIAPNAVIILGGLYATLCPEHAENVIAPDYLIQGSIDENHTWLPELFQLKRIQKPNPYYKLKLYHMLPFSPIVTSTGCPNSCTYCASPVLHQRFSQRPIKDVCMEIAELYQRGVKDFAFYDDALLIQRDSHIKRILNQVIQMQGNLRFHCPNGLHARYIDHELAYLMKKSGFKTIRLSLETVNQERQTATGGKIENHEFKNAVKQLKKHGFTKKELGVYLMYGLPGQHLHEVREGVDFLKAAGVRIHLTEFSPIPKTQSFNQLIKQGIITHDIDPLLTNNTVFSYLFSGYGKKELKRLKEDVQIYNYS